MMITVLKTALYIAAMAGFLYFWYWMIKERENVKQQQYDAIEDDYV
jgi:hypothetical protein